MIQTSRSKIESWYTCPTYRYLKYHYAGTGIQPVRTKGPTETGKCVHRCLARVLTEDNVDKILVEELASYEKEFPLGIPFHAQLLSEQKCLIEGIVRVFSRIRIPQIKQLGTIIAVEVEMPFQLTPDIQQAFRADAVIKTPSNELIIVDFKPTADGGYSWVRKWERNHQILSYVCGAQAISELPVLGVQIEGYVRGKRRFDNRLFDGKVKINDSPLCYVFENQISGIISPDFQRGGEWKKVPLWETSLSPKEYIEEFLTEDQLLAFVAPMPPICPTPSRIERWRRQTVANEKRIEESAKLVNFQLIDGHPEMFLKVLDEEFPQNQEACYKYGEEFACEMLEFCFNGEVSNGPLESGLFEEREDHHNE